MEIPRMVSQAVVLFLKDPKTQAFRSKKENELFMEVARGGFGHPERLPWSCSLSADCVPGKDNAVCSGDSIFVHLHNLIFIKVYSND